MRDVIAAWRRSGQSVAAFARGNGLQPHRVLWWRKRLGEWSVGEATAMAVADHGAALVPAEVVTLSENV